MTDILILGRVTAPRGTYGNNVWDMQLHRNKIYIGIGNSSNLAPDGNTGAGELMYIDVPTDKLVGSDFTPPEEQIESFRLINTELVIPGHDLKGVKPPSRYYTMKPNGEWSKHTVKGSDYHTYDIFPFAGFLFAGVGGGLKNMDDCAYVSGDDGQTWKLVPLAEPPTNQVRQRTYRFFAHWRKLFAVVHNPEGYPLRRWDGVAFTRVGTPTQEQMFPNADFQPLHPPYNELRPERITSYGANVVYIGARPTNDHQWEPVGLWAAKDLSKARKIPLQPGDVPWDIIRRGNRFLVLTSVRISDTRYAIRVISSTNLTNWTEHVSFVQPTFARSFEEAKGSFYFGLGTGTGKTGQDAFYFGPSYTTTVKKEAGTIIKITPAR